MIILLFWMYLLAAFMLLGGERMQHEREVAEALAKEPQDGSREAAARGQATL